MNTLCKCGCGQKLGWSSWEKVYASNACKQRDYRRRKARAAGAVSSALPTGAALPGVSPVTVHALRELLTEIEAIQSVTRRKFRFDLEEMPVHFYYMGDGLNAVVSPPILREILAVLEAAPQASAELHAPALYLGLKSPPRPLKQLEDQATEHGRAYEAYAGLKRSPA